jgi:hypothetical protein
VDFFWKKVLQEEKLTLPCLPKPTNENMCSEFSKIMQKEFEMSMMGELNFFLGLQIEQTKNGIFINQSKYIKDLLKKFGIEKLKIYTAQMSSTIKLDKDENEKMLTLNNIEE